MTEPVRGAFLPASAGRTVDPVDAAKPADSLTDRGALKGQEPLSPASPEQRIGEWEAAREVDAFPSESIDLDGIGIDPAELTTENLIREMQSLYRTRLDTLRHAADAALATHLRRTAELETEYLARFPGREIDASRLRGV